VGQTRALIINARVGTGGLSSALSTPTASPRAKDRGEETANLTNELTNAGAHRATHPVSDTTDVVIEWENDPTSPIPISQEAAGLDSPNKLTTFVSDGNATKADALLLDFGASCGSGSDVSKVIDGVSESRAAVSTPMGPSSIDFLTGSPSLRCEQEEEETVEEEEDIECTEEEAVAKLGTSI
jgi:hypothetical protein